MDPLLVGVDIGTTKIKVCVFDNKGKLLKQTWDDVCLLMPKQGYVEIDLNDLMIKLKDLLKLVAVEYGQYIESIGFSVTSPTLILMDKELNAVRPGICYLDNRCLDEVSMLVDKIGGQDNYFARIGNKPSPSTCSAALIRWIMKNESANWEKTYKIGFLNSFLAAQFTGNIVVEPTVASYSGLVDVKKPCNWDEELVKVLRINRQVLPDVKPSYYKVGILNKNVACEVNLKAGISVAIGSADSAAASLALGLKKHGDVFQSMGTSEVLTFCLDKPDFSEAFMNRSHVIPGLWLCHGAMSTTGAAITWLMKNVFTDFDDVKDMEREAEKSPLGSNGIIFLPYLSGERSPIFDSNAKGLFFGLTLNTSRSDIIRSVYEGAGYGVRQIYNIADSKWNIKPEYIKCAGGATKSKLAMQIRADLLNVKLKSIEADCASAYGAALQGGLAAGIYQGLDELPYLDSFLTSVYPKVEDVEKYNNYIEVYNNLYPALKESMYKLLA